MQKKDIDAAIIQNQELSYKEIAEITGISAEAVRKRYHRLNLPPKRVTVQNSASDSPVDEQIKQDIKLLHATNAKRVTDRKYKALLRQIEEAEAERDAVLQMHDNINTTRIVPTKNIHSEATAVLVASDWHVEEHIKPETVNGLNCYDLTIAEQRAKSFFANGRRLIEICRKDVDINTVVLALLGDFISGHIHDELMEGNLLSPVDAVIFAQNLVASGIEHLLEDKKIQKIVIPCHSGNHGRMTAKRRVATERENSLEFFMYHQLQNHFRGNPRVEFIVAGGYHTYLDVYNTTLRFHHGHSISYGGGVGGITVPVNKAIAQWDKLRRADIDVFGHFHQFFDGGKFVCNGSLIGWSPYALSIKAGYELPRQAFFLIDKKRGKTIVAPILLGE